MAKRKKKNKFFKNFITFIFILAIIGVVGFLGYKSYLEIQSISNDVQNFEYNIPSEITDKIDLPTKIGEKITIEWSSSNKEYLSNNGEINFPTFEDGDKQVTLTG